MPHDHAFVPIPFAGPQGPLSRWCGYGPVGQPCMGTTDEHLAATDMRPADDAIIAILDRVWFAAVDASSSPDFTDDDEARERYRGRVLAEARTALLDSQATWPVHLRDHSPHQRCGGCGRYTWAPDQFGQECGMPQPRGPRCAGRFIPVVTDVP